MTTSLQYTVLLPRIDHSGPANVAIDLAVAMADAGHPVQVLYLSRSSVQRSLPAAIGVRRFRLSDLWRLQGVIHSHCLRPDLVAGLLSLAGRRTTVTTIHNIFRVDLGFDHPRWKVTLAWHAWAFAIGRMTHRVCISGAMQRVYRRSLPDLDFQCIYNFRSPPGSRAAPPLDPFVGDWIRRHQEQGVRVLCYVGSLSPRKNVAALVAHIARGDRFAVVLCGDGPLSATLGEAVRSSGADQRVLMLGQVPDPSRVVSACDGHVLPSFAEGMPLAVLEATSVGRPSLLSNISVHRELERLGIGSTFDHRRFRDFDAVGLALLPTPKAPTSQRIREIWHASFSPAVGLASYRRLMFPDLAPA